jgi:hypothetical protein
MLTGPLDYSRKISSPHGGYVANRHSASSTGSIGNPVEHARSASPNEKLVRLVKRSKQKHAAQCGRENRAFSPRDANDRRAERSKYKVRREVEQLVRTLGPLNTKLGHGRSNKYDAGPAHRKGKQPAGISGASFFVRQWFNPG